MNKTFTEIEREATEFRYKFGTAFYTQVSEDCYSIHWGFANGLRAYTDDEGLHFTGINTIWDMKTNEFDAVFVIKSNNTITNCTHDDLEDWAKNGFNNIEAIVVKGEGGELWHYITPNAEDYHISRGYATCDICIRELLYA